MQGKWVAMSSKRPDCTLQCNGEGTGGWHSNPRCRKITPKDYQFASVLFFLPRALFERDVEAGCWSWKFEGEGVRFSTEWDGFGKSMDVVRWRDTFFPRGCSPYSSIERLCKQKAVGVRVRRMAWGWNRCRFHPNPPSTRRTSLIFSRVL